jgi:hypothetical protein
MNRDSTLPSSIEHNVVTNERRRIIEQCTSNIDARSYLDNLLNILEVNGPHIHKYGSTGVLIRWKIQSALN